MRPFLEKTKNFPLFLRPAMRYLNNGTVARLMTHSGPLWRVGDSTAAASSSLSPRVVTHLKMIRHTRTQGLPPLLLVAWHKLEVEDGRKRTVLAWSVLFQLAARKKEKEKKKANRITKPKKHKRHERERESASAKKHCGNGLG